MNNDQVESGTEQRNLSRREAELRVAKVWREVLGISIAAPDLNFFEAGGTSLLAAVLHSRLNRAFGLSLPIAAVFESPTIRAMAERWGAAGERAERSMRQPEPALSASAALSLPSAPAIAIIGMTGRFPGARSVEAFWSNLASGVESISRFDPAELESKDPASALPGYVPARPILDGVGMFDAAFFGIYPREAEQMDPQHRIFLECAWETLERAGYDPARIEEAVGVFAGCSMNTYFMQNLASGRRYLEDFAGSYQTGSYVTMLGNDKDFLATRVSYKLNLRGPGITVQSACSTSLVAVCQACDSLLSGGCDMALAGGVSITFPQKRGYMPQEGGLASLDGHCRPFDHRANGTVFGHGAAVVLLKRLDDALRDGDRILASIRGWAVNNDGDRKVGYTAPSVEGQARVVRRAQTLAGVPAESITHIEAHGTGTPLGDPIEVAALTQAFRASASGVQFCSLGSAKANVGHLDVAAGATGLIKTVLQMEHRQIPKLLHFEEPNPHLDLPSTPFFVQRELGAWRANGFPLRAGVSAFGVGGTNAHVIVEEAPAQHVSSEARPFQLLLWSAKSSDAARNIASELSESLGQPPEVNLADAAYTLQIGRGQHKHRRAVLAATTGEAQALLAGDGSEAVFADDHPLDGPGIVFCFPGQGVQSIGMGRRLYECERVFRETLDACDAILHPLLGQRLVHVLYPSAPGAASERRLNRTHFAQPAIFAFEYALAQLWRSWGIEPEAMVGHSVGEFVAACLSGVFSLEDALRLVAARGRFMQDLAPGAMLSVRASEENLVALLPDELDLAAVNSPHLAVVSGPEDAVAAFERRLDAEAIQHRRIAASHAFHSRMVEPALAPFAETLRAIGFQPPSIPFVSTVTGSWIAAGQLATAEYWTRQLRQTVRFRDAAAELLRTPNRIFLELGPRETMAQMIRQTALATAGLEKQRVFSSLAPVAGAAEHDEERAILSALGRLWTAGVSPDWQAFHRGHGRRRILLPTYPFERRLFWAQTAGQQETREGASTMEAIQNNGNINSESSGRIDVSQAANPSGGGSAQPAAGLDSAAPASILDDLKLYINELSGVELQDAAGGASFLELGFDSLFLTQLTQGIKNRYGVKLTFRQIMEEYSTLGALAVHLEATAPAEKRPSRPQSATSAAGSAELAAPSFAAPPAAAPAPLSAAEPQSYEALFAAQMQMLSGLFAQQLDLLRGVQRGAAPPAASTGSGALSQPALPRRPAPSSDATAAAPKTVFSPFKPLQKSVSAGLDGEQQRYLRELTGEYNRRTPGSKAYTQSYRSVFADGRVVSGFHPQIKEMVYPLVASRAAGAFLWDTDGNRYIDMLNGFGAILYGHSPDFIVEAVRRQLERGFPIGPQTELAGECAKLIHDLTGMERVTFANTGSEAVMGAMRVARTVTGRNLVAVFAGDYHGSFDEVLVKAAGPNRSAPAAPGIPRESVANMLVLDYGAAESLEILRRRAGELAAVLAEPVQSRHPDLRPLEFLREVRRITEENGCALIFDEVVTGFRTHPGGMQAIFGIRADLATYGKVVAGGLPIGVLAGSAAYMDAVDGGQWRYGDDSFPEAGVTFYAGTFMRHPLALAAAKASLEHLQAAGGGLQESLARKTGDLASDLRRMFAEFGYPSQLETFSSWFYFNVPAEPRLARLLHFHLREKGIHIQEGFPCFLTTAHTAEDLEIVREAFRDSLLQMQKGRALEAPAATIASSRLPALSVPGSHAPAEPVERSNPPRAIRDLPITEPQREILLGAQLGDEANCAFNESTSLRLAGPLDEAALIRGLEALLERHDALRATIDRSGESIHVASSLPLPMERENLSELSGEGRSQRLAEILKQEASMGFDLFEGPLCRARLLRLASEDHLLIFTAHHIVFDGWSTNVFYAELSQLYNAALHDPSLKGSSLKLDPVFGFGEYAAGESARAAQPERAEAEAFWIEQFKKTPAPLELPTDRPRNALRSYRGTTKRFTLPGGFFPSLSKTGARQGSTPFATLLSGYALLIHRLSQQDEVVIGIPMAGQSQVEGGVTLIGHCVHFLPFLSRYRAGQTVADFLKQTQKTLLDAQDHQDCTYGTLLRKLKIARDPSRLQLVEIQFNLERLGSGLGFAGLAASVEANAKTSVNMDLFFNFVDTGGALRLDCEYNTDLFDASTIDRWFGHLETILSAMTTAPDRVLGEVSLLSPAQRERILTEWNRTAAPYPRDRGIHRVFERQAKETPDKIALVDDRSLSYWELNEKANQLARFLQVSGVRSGDRVAVCMERSLEAVVGMLAILKAGASYAPIDPSYPASRLSYLLADSGARVVLSQRTVTETLPETPANVISLDLDWPTIALQRRDNLAIERTGNDEAYLIYTSGSTGMPKGVMIPHRAVLRLVKNNGFQSFSPEEVFLQLAPLSFDAATLEVWGPLLNGGRLVIAPRGRLSPEDIGRIVASKSVTTLWLTAALFHLMVNEHPEALRPLRQLLAGGDVLSPAHVRRALQALPGLRLINGYGPTENTTFTCCYPVNLEGLAAGTVPIGRPIANTRIYLLDEAMQPVPPGVSGELYAAGDGLALGYLNSPDLTSQKFLDHAFGNGVTERLYRTGDLARYRPDGVVEFLGRADTQVKIRGYRIELAEIECALERSPLVSSAVVAVRTDWVSGEDTPGDKRLAAYVVPALSGDPVATVQELRQQLERELPQYMQPAAIILLENLPRTLNGKVDRRALPAPQSEEMMRQRPTVYPRNAKEEALAQIWARVLGLKEIGVEDSIFQLGGDSLLIFRITTLANQAGLHLSARDIFEHKTVAAICAHLEDEVEGVAAAPGGIQALPRAHYRRSRSILQP